jgi:hypothetical protein
VVGRGWFAESEWGRRARVRANEGGDGMARSSEFLAAESSAAQSKRAQAAAAGAMCGE